MSNSYCPAISISLSISFSESHQLDVNCHCGPQDNCISWLFVVVIAGRRCLQFDDKVNGIINKANRKPRVRSFVRASRVLRAHKGLEAIRKEVRHLFSSGMVSLSLSLSRDRVHRIIIPHLYSLSRLPVKAI